MVPRPAAPDLPDLRLSVWFDAPSSLSTQLITLHARVTNVGTATASHVVVSSTGSLSITWWTPLDGAGVPVEPGQSAVGNADGYVTTTSGPVTLTVRAALLGDDQDASPADNTITDSVPVTHLSGSYRGTVYGDRNGNGAMDHPGRVAWRRKPRVARPWLFGIAPWALYHWSSPTPSRAVRGPVSRPSSVARVLAPATSASAFRPGWQPCERSPDHNTKRS